MRKQQSGFTLIEIAIVLVIIGLLLGGVLKGQELIQSARVRNLISQQDGIKAAYFGFLDRFRSLPGDYGAASTNIKCTGTCLNGDGDGVIEAAGAVEPHEDILAWNHLTAAGFINGSYNMTAGDAAPSEANNPKNPYGVYLQLIYDNNYYDSSATPPSKHNLKTGAQIPVEILVEVDRKVDDGNAQRGGFRFSRYQGNASAQPGAPAAAYAAGVCVDSDDGTYFATQSEPNCGGASLF